MLKKVMLGIVAVILLLGAENLLAKEKEDKPQAKQKQKQVQKETKRKKSKAKRSDKKKADKKSSRNRKKASAKKRRQRPAKEAEAKKAKAAKARAERAWAAAIRKRREQLRDKAQQPRPGANPALQQMFGKWLDELTDAYRENDREKMGQLIRKMHQLRQRLRQARASSAWRDLPGWQGRDMQPPKDLVRPMLPDIGMRNRGRGFQGRGMGQGPPDSWRPRLRDPELEKD